MRQGGAYQTEREALAIVISEEVSKGWVPRRFTKSQERVEGCDLVSRSPDGVEHRVEVKGWGQPLLDARGITGEADINAEQMERARTDPLWRLEIVANLTAARTTGAPIERLTVTASEVATRSKEWKYRVRLDGLESRVERAQAPTVDKS